MELGVLRDAPIALQLGEAALEAVRLDTLDDLAEHLDQPAIRVVGEARVARRGRESLDRNPVEAEIEDRVHHPGHRDGGARADGDQQRVVRVAEALPRALLQPGDVLLDFGLEPVRQLLPRRAVRPAGVRRDREACRNRDTELGHLGEPDAFAAQKLAAAARVVVEGVDVAHRA